MPVVFALQNAPLALNLMIEWELFRIPTNNNIGNWTFGGLGWVPEQSPAAIYYEYLGVYDVTTVEGTWSLSWIVSSINCTQFPPSNSSLIGYQETNTVFFTTKNGAQAADLVAATADDVCAGAESFAFNVTGVETVPDGVGNEVTSCAVVATMTPTPNPCAAQLNTKVASSISSALSSQACTSPSSLVSCPTTTKSTGSTERQMGGPMWVIVTLGVLLYTIIG